MPNTLATAWAEPQCDHGRIQVSVHRPRVSSAIARFMLGSLAAIAVTVIGGFFVLRSIAVSEAERDTRARVQVEGRLVEAAGVLTDDVFKRDPAALAKLDDVVQSQILGESVLPVRIWSPAGTILYSDDPALIGQKFALGEEEQELFETGRADAEPSG